MSARGSCGEERAEGQRRAFLVRASAPRMSPRTRVPTRTWDASSAHASFRGGPVRGRAAAHVNISHSDCSPRPTVSRGALRTTKYGHKAAGWARVGAVGETASCARCGGPAQDAPVGHGATATTIHQAIIRAI